MVAFIKLILINFFIIEIISFTTLYFIAPHKNLELPYLKSDEAFKKYDPNLLYYMHDKLRWGQKRPFYSKKSKGDYLIYLLGGSTVEGEGVQDIKDSIAFQLEKKLNEKIKDLGLKIKVINEGISGYASKQQFLLSSIKLIPFQKPDMIIFLDGVNEFFVNVIKKKGAESPYQKSWHPYEYSFSKSVWNNNLLSTLWTVDTTEGSFKSFFFKRLNVIVQRTYFGNALDTISSLTLKRSLSSFLLDIKVDYDLNKKVSKEEIDYYLNNIDMTMMVSKKKDIKFLWMLQPVLFLKKNKSSNEERVYNQMPRSLWNNFREFYSDVRVRGKDFNFYDLSNLFLNEGREVFVDNIHYNKLGQRLIAEKMASHILNNLVGPNGKFFITKKVY